MFGVKEVEEYNDISQVNVLNVSGNSNPRVFRFGNGISTMSGLTIREPI
jgi:hypothetical protein